VPTLEKHKRKRGRPKGKRTRTHGVGALMSVAEFHAKYVPDKGRNQAYSLAKSGLFPFIRNGRNIDLLREPTEAIMAGRMPPGEPIRRPGAKLPG
jgi:hypothetical protein